MTKKVIRFLVKKSARSQRKSWLYAYATTTMMISWPPGRTDDDDIRQYKQLLSGNHYCVGTKMSSSYLAITIILILIVQGKEAGAFSNFLCRSACSISRASCYISAGIIPGTGAGDSAAEIACNQEFDNCKENCADLWRCPNELIFLEATDVDTHTAWYDLIVLWFNVRRKTVWKPA